VNSEHRGIPTAYKGVNMRSRLEARWACMFDLLGWSWEYEPIDLPGWIPDFRLNGHLLVEVRPKVFREGLYEKMANALATLPKDTEGLGGRSGGQVPGAWVLDVPSQRPLEEYEWFGAAPCLLGTSVWGDPGHPVQLSDLILSTHGHEALRGHPARPCKAGWAGFDVHAMCDFGPRVCRECADWNCTCKPGVPWSEAHALWVRAGNAVQWMPGRAEGGAR
jgi:hypothetical protein